jgi:hypothetical protein
MDTNRNVNVPENDGEMSVSEPRVAKTTTVTLSVKQINYLENLCANLDVLPLAAATTYLKRQIHSMYELTRMEFIRFIYHLRAKQPLRPHQLQEIRENYVEEKLAVIFKVPEIRYEELRYFHYQVLFENRFKTTYHDHPLENGRVGECDYEYGWQESALCLDGKLYYLKFYDFLMLDYDKLTLEEVLAKLQPFLAEYQFRIYQTYAGYHVYLISHQMNHRYAKEFMRQLDCDFFYTKFVYNNGFKIRLTKKEGRPEEFLEKFCLEVGEGQQDSRCLSALEIRARFLGDA